MDLWYVMIYNGGATGKLHEIYGIAGIFSSQEMAERACIGRRNYCIAGPAPLDRAFRYRQETFDENGMVGYWPEAEGFRVINPNEAAPLRHADDAALGSDDTPWPWEVTADLIANAEALVRNFKALFGAGYADAERADDGGDGR